MRVFGALVGRELAAFFLSPTAYVILVFFLGFMGTGFSLLVLALSEGMPALTVMRALYGDSPFLWISLLIVVPLLTMRLFAEEKRSGTLETLMTAPVTETAVVLAKFLAAVVFFAMLWAPTAAYGVILQHLSRPTPVDLAPMFTSYLGILLVGQCYLAIGLLASALARSQLVAGMVSFGILGIMLFAGVLPYFSTRPGMHEVGRYLSALDHMRGFSWGVIDSRPVVFYLSVSAWVLFATIRVVESRRWK